MASSKKSSPAVVLVVLMLILTQPAYSKRRPGRSGVGKSCKAKCYLKCLPGFFSVTFASCIGMCLVYRCGAPGKTFSNPSFQCGVRCVRSKCSEPGAGSGNVPEKCVSSCVNGCDAKFAGDIY